MGKRKTRRKSRKARKGGGKAKVLKFDREGVVLIYCPRINGCVRFCPLHKKFADEGLTTVCLNPKFHSDGDAGKILQSVLKRREKFLVKN